MVVETTDVDFMPCTLLLNLPDGSSWVAFLAVKVGLKGHVDPQPKEFVSHMAVLGTPFECFPALLSIVPH